MSTKKEIIVVTGATGNIGKAVIKELIAKGYAPRAVVRKQKLDEAWDKAGVEQAVVEDGADVTALRKVFEGATSVFSMSPLVENLIALGAATVEAAKQAEVKKIVRSSSLGAGVDAPITMGRWHGEVERAIENSGLEYAVVQPASFFQNYLGYADTIKAENAFYAPLGNGKISLIDARDIAAVAAEALTDNKYNNQKLPVTGGESLSSADIATILSDVLGRKITYVDVPEDKAWQQMIDSKMPEWMVNQVMELNAISKAGYVADVLPTVKEVTGKNPRTFQDFVEENKAIFQ